MSLEAYVKEVAGADAELAAKMLELIGGNKDAASRFSNGFMRQADYTKKTQEASQVREQAEQLLTQRETELEAANARIKGIMNDLSKDRVSLATANAQLRVVKEKYGLSDEDIPSHEEVDKTQRTGKVQGDGVDIEERLKTFKTDIVKQLTDELMPHLTGLAAIPIVWDDINHEHQQLTGKRLSKADQVALLKEAREKNTSLENLWDEKYGISALRQTKHDESVAARAVEDFQKKETARRTEEAMEGVRGNNNPQNHGERQSAVLRKDFRTERGDGQQQQQQQQKPPVQQQKQAPALRGAEKAAANYMARRAQGIPLGAPAQKAS